MVTTLDATKILLFVFASALTTAAFAAEPLFETTLVFLVAPKNKPNYRIPAIMLAPNGEILIIAEKRNDGIGDIGNHDIVLKRSADKGKTWSDEQVVVDDEDRVCTDLTIGCDRSNGTIFLFFLKDKKQFVYCTSRDSGATWQGPNSIHAQVTKPEWDQLASGKSAGNKADPSSGGRARNGQKGGSSGMASGREMR